MQQQQIISPCGSSSGSISCEMAAPPPAATAATTTVAATSNQTLGTSPRQRPTPRLASGGSTSGGSTSGDAGVGGSGPSPVTAHAVDCRRARLDSRSLSGGSSNCSLSPAPSLSASPAASTSVLLSVPAPSSSIPISSSASDGARVTRATSPLNFKARLRRRKEKKLEKQANCTSEDHSGSFLSVDEPWCPAGGGGGGAAGGGVASGASSGGSCGSPATSGPPSPVSPGPETGGAGGGGAASPSVHLSTSPSQKFREFRKKSRESNPFSLYFRKNSGSSGKEHHHSGGERKTKRRSFLANARLSPRSSCEDGGGGAGSSRQSSAEGPTASSSSSNYLTPQQAAFAAAGIPGGGGGCVLPSSPDRHCRCRRCSLLPLEECEPKEVSMLYRFLRKSKVVSHLPNGIVGEKLHPCHAYLCSIWLGPRQTLCSWKMLFMGGG